MGDRRVIVLKFSEEYGADLGIYTHWAGSEAEETARRIVASKSFQSRMGDETYAARVFVDQFTQSARDQETGYGLFAVLADNPNEQDEDIDQRVYVNLMTGAVGAEASKVAR